MVKIDLVDAEGKKFDDFITNNNREDAINDLDLGDLTILIGLPFIEFHTTKMKTNKRTKNKMMDGIVCIDKIFLQKLKENKI